MLSARQSWSCEGGLLFVHVHGMACQVEVIWFTPKVVLGLNREQICYCPPRAPKIATS